MKPISSKLPSFEDLKSGFESKNQNNLPLDTIGRKADGEKLSELVERIDQPLVIAFDGAWGSGKSFFLRSWVNEHNKPKYEHNASVIYFDAFTTDYFDDPIIALTTAISDELEKKPESKAAKAWKFARSAAPFLGKAALRLGTSAIVGHAVSLTSNDDGSANEIAESLAIESGELTKSLAEFWAKEDGKRAAMAQFKSALEQLTRPNEDGIVSQKLVVVVDELDRCRPDYALELLEIAKHFFKVSGIHFVLGVNLKELQNSVRVRYGTGISADKYLQKFYDVVFRLSSHSANRPRQNHVEDYFEHLCNEYELDNSHYQSALGDYIRLASTTGNIQLRDVERIISSAYLTKPIQNSRDILSWRAVAGLIVISIVKPDWIERISQNSLEYDEFIQVFPLLSSGNDVYEGDQLSEIWKWLLGKGETSREALIGVGLIETGRIAPDRDLSLRSWINEYLWEVSNTS